MALTSTRKVLKGSEHVHVRAHARALPHDIIIRYTVLAELEPKQVEPGSMNLRLGTNFCGAEVGVRLPVAFVVSTKSLNL